MNLARALWEELLELISESKRAWVSTATTESSKILESASDQKERNRNRNRGNAKRVKDAVDRILMTFLIAIDPGIHWNIAKWEVTTGHRVVTGNSQSVMNNRCSVKYPMLRKKKSKRQKFSI
jgi:hypothetical protein